MAEDRALWLNIDISTSSCALHRHGCRHEADKRETPYKGIGHLKRDGGWIRFGTIGDIEAVAGSGEARKCEVVACSLCCGDGAAGTAQAT